MGISVKIACQGSAELSIDSLEPFQGNLKDLSKENYEKLKKEILDLGFSEPISVWQVGQKNYVLGGHQRLRTLLAMRTEGYAVPNIPVSFVQAANEKEAKRKILALTSQYGEMTRQGLYEFALDAEITASELAESFRFPEINIESFENEFFKDQEPEDQERDEDTNDVKDAADVYLNNNIKQIVLFYGTEEFENVLGRANELLGKYQLEDFSSLFVKLMEIHERT